MILHVLPFGLHNSPATFQKVTDNTLRDIDGCMVNDIVIYSVSLQEHLLILNKIFRKFRELNLKIKQDKTEFLKKEAKYLGHITTCEGIKPNQDKIKKQSRIFLFQTKHQKLKAS